MNPLMLLQLRRMYIDALRAHALYLNVVCFADFDVDRMNDWVAGCALTMSGGEMPTHAQLAIGWSLYIQSRTEIEA